MAHIVGCTEAHELTTCKRGANQMSHIILRKALEAPTAPVTKGDPPSPENEDMDVAVMKALLAMNEVTKAYALKLDDEALKVFMAKSVDDQAAEAKKAHDAAEAEAKKAADAEAAKVAGETDVNKRLENSEANAAALQKRLDERDRDDVIRKTAAGPDFDGYPGGEEAVFTALKNLEPLAATSRDAFIETLKTTAKLAKATGTEIGARDPSEIAKTMPATVEFDALVTKAMEADGSTKSAATAKIMAMPTHKALASRAMAEQGAI